MPILPSLLSSPVRSLSSPLPDRISSLFSPFSLCFILLVVGSTHLHPFFCSSFSPHSPLCFILLEVMNPYTDQGMFKGDVSKLRQLLEKHEEKSIITSDDFESVNLRSDDDPKLVCTGYTIPRKEKRQLQKGPSPS